MRLSSVINYEIPLVSKKRDPLKIHEKGLMQKLLTGQLRGNRPTGGAGCRIRRTTLRVLILSRK